MSGHDEDENRLLPANWKSMVKAGALFAIPAVSIGILLILLILMLHPNWVRQQVQDSVQDMNAPRFKTIIYEQCEYVLFLGSRSSAVTHKGNCIFCERRKSGKP